MRWYFTFFISENFSATFVQPLTWHWSWQTEEPVPGAIYSRMLSPVARKEPKVDWQGPLRDYALTFERSKEWLGIFRRAAYRLSKKVMHSASRKELTCLEKSCIVEVLTLNPWAIGSILLHTSQNVTDNLMDMVMFSWRTTINTLWKTLADKPLFNVSHVHCSLFVQRVKSASVIWIDAPHPSINLIYLFYLIFGARWWISNTIVFLFCNVSHAIHCNSFEKIGLPSNFLFHNLSSAK